MRRSLLLLAAVAGAMAYALSGHPERASRAPAATQPDAPTAEAIAPYQARFGRARPVVAVVGENAGAWQ